MNNVILIRYGEIFLKGKNRKIFEDLLKNNIFSALSGLKFALIKIPGRLMISDYEESNEAKIINILSKQAGIFSISPATKLIILSIYSEAFGLISASIIFNDAKSSSASSNIPICKTIN